MKYNIIIYFILTFGISLPNILEGQNFEMEVKKAWDKNEMLASKNFQLQGASKALEEAKALFGPTVGFNAQYTLASGGRSIQFPVGDLLNPVYNTLNKLTSTNVFPQISNVNTNFLPNNFYDAKFRITQPIYYPDLRINKLLKAEVIQLKNLEIKAYKRILSREVMTSYFQYESCRQLIVIYNSTDSVLNEARRVTQSLIRNGLALPTSLSRIESQISNLKFQKIQAETNYKNAIKYYNFIIHADNENDSIAEINLPELPDPNVSSSNQREEIDQLHQGIKMQQLSLKKENQFFTPKFGAQIDIGSQAFDFGFKPYALVGLNLEVNLFDSKRHKLRKEIVSSDITALEYEKTYAMNQIELQIKTASENMLSAIDQAKTFVPAIRNAEKTYTEVLKRYKAGSASYLELLDALSQVTQENIQLVLARQNAWIKWSEYIYSTAAFPID